MEINSLNSLYALYSVNSAEKSSTKIVSKNENQPSNMDKVNISEEALKLSQTSNNSEEIKSSNEILKSDKASDYTEEEMLALLNGRINGDLPNKDDVLPEKDCLEKLKANMKEEIGICIPNRSDEKFKDYAVTRFNLKNPFLVYMQKKKKVGNFINKLYEIYDMPFEGPLFNAKIIKKVGLPDKEYFIFYDDSDYCQRCLKYSRALFITDAILHKQIIPKENKSKRLNWRHYYSYRNCIYFDKKYGKNWFVKNLTPKLFIIELMIKNIILFRFYNLKIILKAYKDANKNIRGKTIEPGSI